eukprot:TRINITY_DN5590_c0_g1_i2.p1 TRINITY_DN5590_c0_g1~~TRINITY_DN5590_c0_g1_i2.p1  ORF type:complete len:134 (+),score=18.66 TRINITY_DN5590_c0_g1_i2:66-467(+)
MADMVQLGNVVSDAAAKVVHLKGQPLPINDVDGLVDWRSLWQAKAAHDEACVAVKLTEAKSWQKSLDDGNHQMVHIGISDSEGTVYSFSQQGSEKDAHGWTKCLTVPLAHFGMCVEGLSRIEELLPGMILSAL